MDGLQFCDAGLNSQCASETRRLLQTEPIKPLNQYEACFNLRVLSRI